MTVDISSEAFDWKAAWHALDEEHRAQAERIKELELSLSVSTEEAVLWFDVAQRKTAKARIARNDALREAAQHIRDHAEVARKKMREAYELGSRDIASTWSAIISHLDIEVDAILALIEGATND
ncbi:MAG: hypothetical protein GOVbin2937_86 [Prokaryotic dsDNA virus sp.]|nr:MAG: hypothetical protein GOVbin2937_86 [Prokaryotic dsDNA virus sp.]|tara:strand:+ start:563 stop:934 length:372 start_codon:yes stop_codon:yes gene_type:complete